MKFKKRKRKGKSAGCRNVKARPASEFEVSKEDNKSRSLMANGSSAATAPSNEVDTAVNALDGRFGDDSDIDLQFLQDLREEQRERRRKGGISASAMMRPQDQRSRGVSIGSQPEADALFDGVSSSANVSTESKARGRRAALDTVLVGAFAAESGVEGGGSQHESQLMQQYVAKRMAETAAKTDSSDGRKLESVSRGSKGVSGRGGDLLYEVPLDLRKRLLSKTEAAGDSGQAGGPMFAMGGIAEVELPAAFRLKNIRDTEAATQRLLEEMGRKGSRPRRDRDGVPNGHVTDIAGGGWSKQNSSFNARAGLAPGKTNFSSNFTLHRRQHGREVRIEAAKKSANRKIGAADGETKKMGGRAGCSSSTGGSKGGDRKERPDRRSGGRRLKPRFGTASDGRIMRAALERARQTQRNK